MSGHDKKTLILRFSAMGDVAMVAPVLENVVKNNSDAKFIVVTSSRYDAFFSHIKNVETICIDTKDKHRGIIGMFNFALFLVKNFRFSKVIDLHSVIRSRVLCLFLTVLGKHVYRLDKMHDVKKEILKSKSSSKELKKTVYRYSETFLRAGYKVDFEETLKKVRRPINSLPSPFTNITDSGKNLIGFAPFAGHKGKICPDSLAEDIIKRLSERENTTVLLFGGSEEERTKCEQWEKVFPDVISTVRKLSLTDEIALISNLDVMISMDSSAQHIASLTGTRAITIWGATQPVMGFLGYGQSYEDVVTLSLDCSPCSVYGNIPCYKETYECLHKITADKVIEKL